MFRKGHFSSEASEDPLKQDFRFEVKHIPLKRIFDIAFSLLTLAIILPIILIVALIVKFSSKGNIFYGHERIGRGGKIFKCYKFRTMHVDAEQKLNELLIADDNLRQQWEEAHKLKNDPRVTPVGDFLRKTSLDELPQFWNVLKGDLSVVGPRPVVKAELTKYFGAKAFKILSVRPGITGIWQVSGRSDTSYKTRVMLDEKYVDDRSMLLDIKLIAKTIPTVINSKGAY